MHHYYMKEDTTFSSIEIFSFSLTVYNFCVFSVFVNRSCFDITVFGYCFGVFFGKK